MLEDNEIIIEAVEGKLHRLVYKSIPDLTVIFSRQEKPKKIFFKGKEDLLSEQEYKSLLDLNNVIQGNRLLQWSYTTSNAYFFHDMRELVYTHNLENFIKNSR